MNAVTPEDTFVARELARIREETGGTDRLQ